MPCTLIVFAALSVGGAAEPGEGPDCFSTLGLTCGTVPSNAEWVCNDLGNACVTLEVDPETYDFTVGWRHYEVDWVTAQVAFAGHFVDGERESGCLWGNARNGGCAYMHDSGVDLTKCYEVVAYITEATVASGVELRQSFGDC